MKAVVAFIRPSKEEAVTDALHAVEGLTGASFTPIHGFGRGRGDHSRREIDEAVTGTMPQVRVEVMTSDALAPKVAAVITEAAHTGNRGDGKVYVYSLDSAVRISTHETGEGAV